MLTLVTKHSVKMLSINGISLDNDGLLTDLFGAPFCVLQIPLGVRDLGHQVTFRKQIDVGPSYFAIACRSRTPL